MYLSSNRPCNTSQPAAALALNDNVHPRRSRVPRLPRSQHSPVRMAQRGHMRAHEGTGRDIQDSSHDVSQNSYISVKHGSVLLNLPIRWGTAAACARSVRLYYPGQYLIQSIKCASICPSPNWAPSSHESKSFDFAPLGNRYSTHLLESRLLTNAVPGGSNNRSQYPLRGRPHATLKRSPKAHLFKGKIHHQGRHGSYSEDFGNYPLQNFIFPHMPFTGGAGISNYICIPQALNFIHFC